MERHKQLPTFQLSTQHISWNAADWIGDSNTATPTINAPADLMLTCGDDIYATIATWSNITANKNGFKILPELLGLVIISTSF